MPLGKGRSRRSGSSSTPVITTIAFVALCVLGVWLLASTPVTPPTTTGKTAAATASSLASSVINFRKTIISDDASKIATPFEDLPGDLPENGGSSSSSTEISNDSQSGEIEKEGVTEKEMADQENGVSVKNQESAASEGLHGKETEEEHKELETQTSEESTLTQQKEIETIKQNAGGKDVSEPEKREENISDNNNQKGGSEETTKVQDSQINSQGSSENKNLISDEDQRKRLEHHQQQEDDQLQQKQQSQPEILETRKDPMKAWMTQADQSCLDNEEALAKIRGRQHFEHRERHCPAENPVCLVPLRLHGESILE